MNYRSAARVAAPRLGLAPTAAALATFAALAFLLLHPAASNAAHARGPIVSTASTSLGRVLVDSRGHTLYLFGKDKHGKSACTGMCTRSLPLLPSHARQHHRQPHRRRYACRESGGLRCPAEKNHQQASECVRSACECSEVRSGSSQSVSSVRSAPTTSALHRSCTLPSATSVPNRSSAAEREQRSPSRHRGDPHP